MELPLLTPTKEETHANSQGSVPHERQAQIISDVLETFNTRARKRCKTLFYRFVRGGAVETVRDVIGVLSKEREEETNWLLGLNGRRPEAPVKGSVVCDLRVPIRLLVFLFVCLPLLVCPLFYIIHYCTVKLCALCRSRKLYEPELPMALAMMSESAEMLILFEQSGVSISETDDERNNLFHYLVKLSIHSPKKAIRCYKVVLQAFGASHLPEVWRLMMKDKNDVDMTPFEMAARDGSPKLLQAMLNTEGVLKRTAMTIDGDEVFEYDGGPGHKSTQAPLEGEVSEGHSGYELANYDITQYERGDLMGQQAYPLNLLNSRDFEAMPQDDITALVSCQFLQDWMAVKIRSTKWTVFCKHVVNLLVTVLLVVYFSQADGDHQTQPMQQDFVQKLQGLGVSRDYLTSIEKELIGVSLDDRRILQPDSNGVNCTENATVFSGAFFDSCSGKALLGFRAACPSRVTDLNILESIGFIPTTAINFTLTANLRLVLLVLCCAYIFLTIVFHAIFILHNFSFTHGKITSSLYKVFAKNVPGPYLDKQLNLGLAWLFIIHSIVLHASSSIQQAGGPVPFIASHDAQSHLLIAMVFLRFISFVWSCRLIPYFGSFVVSVHSMTKNLLDFLMLYSIVVVFFAVLFCFIMRNPACAASRFDDFKDVFHSAFMMYQLMMGETADNYATTVVVRVAYILYTATSLLLLLNFIIAVMSNTANVVMTEPWKDYMLKQEALGEALEAETLMLFFSFPCRRTRHQNRLKAHGMIVSEGLHDQGNTIVMAIEVN